MLALEFAAFWLSGQWVSATFAATPAVVLASPGGSYASWLISCADTDTLMVIPHGFKQTSPSGNPATGFTPDKVTIEPRTSAQELAAAWGVSVSATDITLQKQSAAGSGGTPAAKLVAVRPHSITQ